MNNDEKILKALDVLQADVKGLKIDVAGLKTDVVDVKQGQSRLEQGQAEINSRLSKLEVGQAQTNKQLSQLAEDMGEQFNKTWEKMDRESERITRLEEAADLTHKN